MPKNYINMDLSNKEKQFFFFVAVTFGLITGFLFYNSILPAIALTAVAFAFFPKYKEALFYKKCGIMLIQFRDMLYSISSSISAGRNMVQAMEESIDFWKATYDENDFIMEELLYMTGRIRNGNEKDIDVLRDFAERSGLEDVTDFVNVYESCRLTGGNLPLAIDRATSIIGDKITMERELKTLMAQKIFESRIVITAPFVIVIFLKITAPEYLIPMTTTNQGRIITTFSIGLIALAVYIIERINAIEI